MQLSAFLITLVLITWQQGSNSAGNGLFQKGVPKASKHSGGVPFVKLTNGGILSGTVKFSRNGRPFHSFTGIPYATIPGRFEESVPVKAALWEGVLSATKPGALCPQVPFGASGFGEGLVEAEDCLNLNVYVPKCNIEMGKKVYPVMFWVHGGGFVNGGGFGYGPQYFMDEDVIVVTINYRVGVFGFLSTGDHVVPGNNALKDIVVALRWVQENIKQFGGDPGKVTIFGESAGGAAVHYLLLSTTTKGLFHRAISQSGNALNGWAYFSNPRQEAVEIATHLKCPTTATDPSCITSEEILSCLKGVTMQQLNMAQMTFRATWPANTLPHFFGPTSEPNDSILNPNPFLSEPPVSTLTRKDNQLAEIPWMVGTNEDECAVMFAGVILSKPDILNELNVDWERCAPEGLDYGKFLSIEQQNTVSQLLREFYFGSGEITEKLRWQLTNLFTDEFFLHGAYRAAVETASRGKRHPVYLYQYAYRGPSSMTGAAMHITGEAAERSAHADELQHLFRFRSFFEVFPGAPGDLKGKDERDELFSKNFVKLWASFAIHGEPKHLWGNATSNRWEPISKMQLDGVKPLTWFRINENAGPQEIGKAVKNRMRIWDSIWTEHIAPSMMAKYNKLKPIKQWHFHLMDTHGYSYDIPTT